jgi:hypothetical protein
LNLSPLAKSKILQVKDPKIERLEQKIICYRQNVTDLKMDNEPKKV